MSIKGDHPQHTAEKKNTKQHNKQTNKNLKMPKPLCIVPLEKLI